MPDLSQLTGNIYVLIGGGVAVLIVLLLLVRLLGRGKAGPAQERGLKSENLADFPPPPGAPGPRRLSVHANPVRLRLVIVAPIGRDNTIDAAAVEAELDKVQKGLGALCKQDKPRVRVWPAQMSNQGFAPTFHRLVEKPEADGKPSRWVLMAGPTPSKPRPILLGLVLWADEPNTMGRLTLKPEQWAEALRFQE